MIGPRVLIFPFTVSLLFEKVENDPEKEKQLLFYFLLVKMTAT